MEAVRGTPRLLHVLRSVMLAGAGAVVWLALSSTAANADSGSANNHTLLGGAESAVTNVVHNATAGIIGSVAPASVASVPAPTVASAPAPVIHLPVAQVPATVVHELPRLTQAIDRSAASTPIVNDIIHEGTVGAVTAPVLSPAASAVGGVGSGVGALVGDALSPALDAVGSTVDALPIGSLPITIPGGVGTGGTPSEQPSVPTIAPLAQAVAVPLVSLAGTNGPPGLRKAPWNATLQYVGYANPAVPGSPSDGKFPDGTPGSSDGGNGSAALPSNPSGAATAWLPSMNLFYPFAGALVSTAAAGRVPAPVSFDPGSSPD
ncbi:hypothetical protein [Arthrobacter sp. MMS24-S77]